VAGLQTYQAKRDFAKTREPRGTAARQRGHAYAIQKHAARRLHYDLRLELDGVLKSWAITKGPSLVPGEKRLAVEVEDHPVEYQDFEGTIPKGEYGGGAVIVWDRGTWTPIGDPHKGLAKGHLDFEIDGEKLHGLWHLVRMRRKAREKRNNWLLIKARDDAARAPGEPDVLDERPQSVLSGRTIETVAAAKNGKTWSTRKRSDQAAAAKKDRDSPARMASPNFAALKCARKAALQDFVEPCLATLAAKPPAGDRWVHEIKFDGYRLQARIDAGKVKLRTRGGLDWTTKFGKAVTAALGRLPVRQGLIDGELVVEGETGASDFAALKTALSEGRTDRLMFYAFDLLHADGYDLRNVALVERKTALQALLAGVDAGGPLRLSEHFASDGDIMLKNACRLSLEGIVSKLRNAPYRSGRRHDWIKSKCAHRQEFVVVGYVPSTTGAKAIGSLALGIHENGKLVHVGRVGTGFSAKTARELWSLLDKRRIDKPPVAQKLSAEERRDVRWVRPELVAEVEFRGWTGAHNLRHASFRGLREDKPAREIVREDAQVADRPSAARTRTTSVKLTHPDRIYWPDAGVTKQGLAEYYSDVWKWMAPHLVARPLALMRCPGGIGATCFFQKAAWKGLHRSIAVVRNPGAGGEEVLAIRDLDGLIALVQAGVLEIHPWESTVGDLDHPDRLIFDLDPGPDVGWPELMTAAREVRDRLQALDLAGFLKTTGGKGLHVVAPIEPQADWDAAKAFARSVAEAMAADSPDRYVAKMSKQLRAGHIFVDYLRNGRGATAVAPYSTRARPGAPVSTPLTWDELGPDVRGDHFRVANLATRLAHLEADPWRGFFAIKQRLPASSGGRAKPKKSRSRR
jgi:bifunctional non-homologous end joining protein LigD